MKLFQKTAVVTGSAQGIGYQIALRFFQAGANVVLSDISETCRSAAHTIDPTGERVIAVQGDVSRHADVDGLFEQAVGRFGKVDILVNNAGITRDARFHNMTERQWDEVFSVNVKSMFFTSQAAVKVMMQSSCGAIVNISSLTALTGNFGQANYTASKAGVIGLTRTLSREYAGKGIRVNAVAPGFILTDMVKQIPQNAMETILSRIPMRRGGLPEEVAEAVLFLASDSASFISGQVLSVNGGEYCY